MQPPQPPYRPSGGGGRLIPHPQSTPLSPSQPHPHQASPYHPNPQYNPPPPQRSSRPTSSAPPHQLNGVGLTFIPSRSSSSSSTPPHSSAFSPPPVPSGLASLNLTESQLTQLAASLNLNPYQQLTLQQALKSQQQPQPPHHHQQHLHTQQQPQLAPSSTTSSSSPSASSSSSSSSPPLPSSAHEGHSHHAPATMAAALPTSSSSSHTAAPPPPFAPATSSPSSPPSNSPTSTSATPAPYGPSSSTFAHPPPQLSTHALHHRSSGKSSTDSSTSATSSSASSAVPPPGSEAARTQAKALLKETRELERQLRVLQRTSSGTEKQIFALRKTIRHHYRQVIYLDLAFAAENEVEQALWKYVFYKQIEELRKLLKLHAPSSSSPTSSSLSAPGRALLAGAGVGGVKEHSDRYARLSTFFRQFLRDSKKFYRSLLNYHLKVAKIHRVGGKFRDLLVKGRRRAVDDEDDVFDDEDEDDEEDADVEDTSVSGNSSDLESGDGHDSFNSTDEQQQQVTHQQPSSSFSAQAGTNTSSSSFTSSTPSAKAYTAMELHTMHLALLTCHRSLIFLGDLERYSQLILGPSPDHPDNAGDKGDVKEQRDHRWSKAERYYRWALTIMSCNGNPHNQLAVVATYKQNNLLAVHRYFRSIAVAQPFSTAMQNLKLLFDKQVALNALLHQQHAQQHPQLKLTCEWYELSMPSPKMVDTFIVHLLDVLYTGRNVESGLCLIHGTVRRLEQFLLNSALLSQPHPASPVGSLNVYCLQLLLNAIFCIHQHVPNTQIITSDAPRDEEQKAVAIISPAAAHSATSGTPSPVPRSDPPLPCSFFSEAASGSLSFLFLFDLLRAFMASMSLGHSSSLHRLGIVGVWCDWLHLHPSFIDPLPIFSSPHSPRSQPSDEPERPAPSAGSTSSSATPIGNLPSSPFLEHQRLIRTRCWQAFAGLCNALTLCMDNTAQEVIDAVSLPDQPPLKEELEVYAFSYLSQAYPALTHDFYYRRSDPQSIAELTGQLSKDKETHSPPSISPSTVLGGPVSFSAGVKVSPSLLPTGSKQGREKATGGAGLDKKQYRRAMKVLRFAQFLLRGHSVIKQDAQSGKFYVDSDIHEAPIINPAANAIIRQQHHQHQHHQQQQMAFIQTPSLPPSGLSLQQPGSLQAGSRSSQSSASLLGGSRGPPAPASQVRGLIPSLSSAPTGRATVPSMAGTSMAGGGLLLGMPSHYQQPGVYQQQQQQQQQMAGMRSGLDDFNGSSQRAAVVKRTSADRAGPPMRPSQGSHLGQLEELHSGWRDASSVAAAHHHYDPPPPSRAGQRLSPAVSAAHRPSSAFSSLPPYGAGGGVDDEMDMDAMLEHRMEEDKRRLWRETEQEQAQNQQTFDLPLASPSSSAFPPSQHVKGLINPPRPSTSNPNLSSLHRLPNDALAINTADLSSAASSARSRPSSSSLAFPEPISAGATVGKTSPAGAVDGVGRESSSSPGAEYRHFHYSAAPGQPRGSAPSPPLNSRAADGWEGYNAGGGIGGVGGVSSSQAAPAQFPPDDSAESSASRGWNPFSSQSALPFSFLHQSASLFAQPSPASLHEYEQQQQSIFEQQRRDSLNSNQPGAAESDRHSPSSRSPSPVLHQQLSAAASPPPLPAQTGYGGGQQSTQAPGPPGFRGGGGLISASRSSSSSSAGSRGGSDGGSGGMVGGPSGLFGASASSGILREGGSGGLLGSRGGGGGGSAGGGLPLQSGLSSAWAGSVGQGLGDAYSRSLHYVPPASGGRGRVGLDDGMSDGGAVEPAWPSSGPRDERSSRIEDDIGLDDLLNDEQEAHDLHLLQQHQQQQQQQMHQQAQRERYHLQSLPPSHMPARRAAAAPQYGGGGGAAASPSATRSAAPTSSSSSAAPPYRPPHLQHRENAQPQPYDPYPSDSSKSTAPHHPSSSSHFSAYPGQAGMYGGGHSGSSASPSSSSPAPRPAFLSSAAPQQPQPRFTAGGSSSSSSSPPFPPGSGGQRASK